MPSIQTMTGVKPNDYVLDASSENIKTYKINHIDNIIVAGRLEVQLWLEGEGFKETRTISSDEVVVMRMIKEKDYRVITIVSRGPANEEVARGRTATIIANRRCKLGEGEVNTIDLGAFDKKYPHLAPYKQ